MGNQTNPWATLRGVEGAVEFHAEGAVEFHAEGAVEFHAEGAAVSQGSLSFLLKEITALFASTWRSLRETFLFA